MGMRLLGPVYLIGGQDFHAVYLDSFYIDKTEVTVSQYFACVVAGACRAPDYPAVASQGREGAAQDNHPVRYVTWDHADGRVEAASDPRGEVGEAEVY